MGESVSPRHFRHTAVAMVGLVFLALLMVWARVLYGAYANYEQGVELLRTEAYVRAVTHFDRSLHWYAPFSPYMEKSAARLWQIGEKAECDGDTRLALIAYRTIWRGFYSARSVCQPGQEWMRKSQEKINGFMIHSAEKGRDPVHREETGPAFGQTGDPLVGWSLAAVFGWVGWVGASIGLVLVRWGPWSGRKSSPLATLFCAAGFLLFFAVWVVGMMRA